MQGTVFLAAANTAPVERTCVLVYMQVCGRACMHACAHACCRYSYSW